MSGTAVSQWATDETPMTTAREVAEHNGCPTSSHLTMIKCLQKVPAESIVRASIYFFYIFIINGSKMRIHPI